ncbi:LysM peptidoglycan-binding domain-containing protein [Alphaproteobacteria bacterium]|nr:LysM peptidoglycan-binding domain-containing protein [Alphaproteobacteria bacterium]
MKNVTVIMTAIAAAFCLIILGVYLYQTAPEKDTPNLPETELEAELETLAEQPAVVLSDDQPDADIDPATIADETLISEPAPVFVSLDLVNVSPDGVVVLSGQSNAGNLIEIYDGDNLIASASANGKGDWVAVPDMALAPGTYLLTVTTTTEDGDVILSDRAVVIVIPNDADTPPLVALVPVNEAVDMQAELLQSPFTEDAKDSVISVTDAPVLTVDPTVPVELVADPSLPPQVTIRMIDALTDNRMAVSGFRQGTGNIAVMIDDISAQVSISPEGYLAEAIIPDADQFPVAVAMTDDNGETLASARIILNKAKLDETLSGNALVVVQKGDALWRIAYRTYGEGIRYVDIYSSNAGEIKNPDLIYPDQIFIIPNQ